MPRATPTGKKHVTFADEANVAADGNGDPVDVSDYKAATFILNVTAHDRTTGDETLDVEIQVRDPVSGNWVTLGSLSFTQVAAQTVPHTERIEISRNLGLEARAAWTVGGTSPESTFTVSAILET